MGHLTALMQLPEPPSASEPELAEFSSHLEQEERIRNLHLNRARDRKFDDRMDIVKWLLEARDEGDLDEALWRGFLGAHFGEPLAEAAAAHSAGEILCAFGESPVWTWVEMEADPVSFLGWLLKQRPNLPNLAFGNHRKFEAKQPDLLYEVVVSFVRWVRKNGGSPTKALSVIGGTPEASFNVLFHKLDSLERFGRLGKFDLLCLYADLELLPIAPDSCYLMGASGPLAGARKLWGNRVRKS